MEVFSFSSSYCFFKETSKRNDCNKVASSFVAGSEVDFLDAVDVYFTPVLPYELLMNRNNGQIFKMLFIWDFPILRSTP